MNTKVKPTGWYRFKGEKTYHYYRSGESICGRWIMITPTRSGTTEPPDDHHKCSHCLRSYTSKAHAKYIKLDKRRERLRLLKRGVKMDTQTKDKFNTLSKRARSTRTHPTRIDGSKYPQHALLARYPLQQQLISNFLAWIKNNKRLVLAFYPENSSKLVVSYASPEELIAEYLGINPKTLVEEANQMIIDQQNQETYR